MRTLEIRRKASLWRVQILFYISPIMYNIVFILLRHTRKKKHIGGKIVHVLSSSEADRVFVLSSSEGDRVFEPRSCQTKDYNIGICCFSAKHAASRRKNKD